MRQPTSVGSADLHVHPGGEAGSRGAPRAFYNALRASDLRVAVLTDHNRIDVAQELAVRSHEERIAIELIVGEEITTLHGHLLGAGLAALVSPDLSLAEAVAAVHEQGGIAVVAHPMLPIPTSASARRLRQLSGGDARRRPDALEAMHPLGAWVPG
jgi:predicted metal-dependent phosphoesterase TrpH